MTENPETEERLRLKRAGIMALFIFGIKRAEKKMAYFQKSKLYFLKSKPYFFESKPNFEKQAFSRLLLFIFGTVFPAGGFIKGTGI